VLETNNEPATKYPDRDGFLLELRAALAVVDYCLLSKPNVYVLFINWDGSGARRLQIGTDFTRPVKCFHFAAPMTRVICYNVYGVEAMPRMLTVGWQSGATDFF